MMCEAQEFSPKGVIIWVISVVWIHPKIPIWTSHGLRKVNVTKNGLDFSPLIHPRSYPPIHISTPDSGGGLGGKNTIDGLFSRLLSNPFSTSASREFYQKWPMGADRIKSEVLPVLTGSSPRSFPCPTQGTQPVTCHCLSLPHRHFFAPVTLNHPRRFPGRSCISCFVWGLT